MKLKPCPFCASENVIIKEAIDTFWVNCNGCKSSGSPQDYKKDAVTMWNNRPCLEE